VTPRINSRPGDPQERTRTGSSKQKKTKTFATETFRQALKEAETNLEPRPESADRFVQLRLDEITTRTELFQPRKFHGGLNELDTRHVKALAKQIGYTGELEPILVIRIGGEWIVVDGHHRVEAYRKRAWTKPIRCEWFSGSARAAADASVRRNSQIKLKIHNQDRYEQAWRRVVMSDPETRTGWSKSEIVKLCGVSDGLVGKMRKVQALYKRNDDLGTQFREKLSGRLEQVRWGEAHLTFLGVEQQEYDFEKEAAKLAKRLQAKMDDRLSKDPALTARALAIYDEDLVEPLGTELRGMAGQADEDGTQPMDL